MLEKNTIIGLLEKAKQARDRAYAPYSYYRVGAALLAKNGNVYPGCNVENASFGATNCAERTALFSAIADGVLDFEAIAVVGGLNETLDDSILPCGICCQALSEFCNKDFPVILTKGDSYRVLTLGDIFPYTFSSQNLS